MLWGTCLLQTDISSLTPTCFSSLSSHVVWDPAIWSAGAVATSTEVWYRMCLFWKELDWGLVFHFLSWNHRMGWKGPYSPRISSLCHGLIAAHQIRLPRNPSSPTLGTSRMGHPQLLWATCASASALSIPIILLSCHGLKTGMPWFYFLFSYFCINIRELHFWSEGSSCLKLNWF